MTLTKNDIKNGDYKLTIPVCRGCRVLHVSGVIPLYGTIYSTDRDPAWGGDDTYIYINSFLHI